MLKTKNGKDIAVEELTLADVVGLCELVDHELATKINDLSDGVDDFRFYKAIYKFGAKIIGDGNYYLPLCNGDSIAFDDPDLPKHLLTDLRYDKRTSDPLCLILSKNSEIYKSSQDRIQSYQVLKPGYMFGIPRAIDKTGSEMTSSISQLRLNAGARTISVLSKISDQAQHHKIQEYFNTTISAPKTFLEQHAVFVEIAKNFDWHAEIIIFPENFINKIKSSEWLTLSDYLTQKHRTSYGVSHYKLGLWVGDFHEIEHEKKLTKYKMQSLQTVKDLIYLAAGGRPGLQPATTDDSAPFSLLKEAYADQYQLAQPQHSMVFMEPVIFDVDPIYFSLNYNYPTSTKNHLEASNKKSNIGLVEEFDWLLNSYSGAILSSEGKVDQLLYDVMNRTTFSCFHSTPKDHKKILNARKLATEDLRFTQGNSDTFPITSQFFKGCIQIAKKP